MVPSLMPFCGMAEWKQEVLGEEEKGVEKGEREEVQWGMTGWGREGGVSIELV